MSRNYVHATFFVLIGVIIGITVVQVEMTSFKFGSRYNEKTRQEPWIQEAEEESHRIDSKEDILVKDTETKAQEELLEELSNQIATRLSSMALISTTSPPNPTEMGKYHRWQSTPKSV